MRTARSTENPTHEVATPAAPPAVQADADAVVEHRPAGEGFVRTFGRGLLLVALGVGSHMWLDARRATLPGADELAGADVAVVAQRGANASTAAVPSAAVANTHQLGTRAERPIDSTRETIAASAAVAAERTIDGPATLDPAPTAVGTTGVVDPADASDQAGPEPSARRVAALSGGRATDRATAPDVVLASNTTTAEGFGDAEGLEEAAVQSQPWRLVAAVEAVPAAARGRRTLTAPVGVAPVAASFPSATRHDAPPPPEFEVVADDEHSILLVIEQYQQAFNTLDVGAATRIWPDVDKRALTRAFSDLEAQSIRLEDCGVTLASSAAQARCRGVATYQPKVGRRPQQLTREWTFTLARTESSDWRIRAVR
jgi:hypothetical protein